MSAPCNMDDDDFSVSGRHGENRATQPMDPVGRCTPHRWQCGPAAVRKRQRWRAASKMVRGKVCKTARNNDSGGTIESACHGTKGVKCVCQMFPSTRTNCQSRHPKTAHGLSACELLLIAILMYGGGGLRKPPTSFTHTPCSGCER
jgi:hypothetical protein